MSGTLRSKILCVLYYFFTHRVKIMCVLRTPGGKLLYVISDFFVRKIRTTVRIHYSGTLGNKQVSLLLFQ